MLTYDLPAGVSLDTTGTPLPGGCSIDVTGRTVTCDAGTVAPAGSVVRHPDPGGLRCRRPGPLAGTLVATSNATDTDGATGPANVQATAPVADLAITTSARRLHLCRHQR
ncbi:MAG: hypothetical protein R2710_04310 [Acidimicrobiales bacterium]